MQENTEELQKVTQQETVQEKAEVKNDPDALKKMSTMQAKALQNLTRVHLESLLNELAFKPGLTGNQKQSLIKAIVDGVVFPLDFGVEITKAKLPSGRYAKRATEMAGILAQALDNKMLLQAIYLKQDQEEQDKQTTSMEESKNDNV